MTRRPGLTLTEVLVTLAILAFGILAILTLFPLAASQMAVAVREDRSAQAANAADGYMRAYWKKEFVEKAGAGETAITLAFDDPDGTGTLLSLATTGEPSYPVVIDPMGVAARSSRVSKDWVGDEVGATPGSYVPRKTLATIMGTVPAPSQNLFAFRLCSLMDGMGYTDDGRPTQDREMRYNWAWILQCQDAGVKTVANMSVIVYDNRPNLYAPTGAEVVYTAPAATPKSTQLVFTGSVNVKPGGWVMDVTVTDSPKIRHADCYRVMSVSDNGTTLELETPIRPDPVITGTYSGKFVVLRGVTAVYPRLPLTGN